MKRKQLFESIDLVQEKYKDDENNLWGFCDGVKDYILNLEKKLANQKIKYRIIMKSGREYSFDAHYSEYSIDELFNFVGSEHSYERESVVRLSRDLVLDVTEIESIQQLN